MESVILATITAVYELAALLGIPSSFLLSPSDLLAAIRLLLEMQ